MPCLIGKQGVVFHRGVHFLAYTLDHLLVFGIFEHFVDKVSNEVHEVFLGPTCGEGCYAGLSAADGTPLYYSNESSEPVSQITLIDDLEYSGTRIPRFTGSLENTFSYKNFDLSFMFVFYGGHVFRDQAAAYLSLPPTTNIYNGVLNAWRQPGDELLLNVTPAITGASLSTEYDLHPWYTANIHVKKADFLKLRDISLTYNFDKQLISRIGMSSLALTLQAQNLFAWTANDSGVDPEAMTTTGYGWGARGVKIPTTWTIGVSANF